jgi:C4-dicarboxylate-specific signal transduction histidine kinase
LILRAYFLRRQFVSRLEEQKEELTKLLAELNATQSQLVQSEKMASLGVLTAGIAHEINNAINFVYSGIQILSNSYFDIRPILTNLQEIKAKNGTSGELKIDENIDLEESVNYIDQMIESIVIGAERTTDIVKGLRTFSRSEDENKTEIDVHEDLEVALLLLNSRIKNVIDIKKGLKATYSVVSGYKGQLSQALLNSFPIPLMQ